MDAVRNPKARFRPAPTPIEIVSESRRASFSRQAPLAALEATLHLLVQGDPNNDGDVAGKVAETVASVDDVEGFDVGELLDNIPRYGHIAAIASESGYTHLQMEERERLHSILEDAYIAQGSSASVVALVAARSTTLAVMITAETANSDIFYLFDPVGRPKFQNGAHEGAALLRMPGVESLSGYFTEMWGPPQSLSSDDALGIVLVTCRREPFPPLDLAPLRERRRRQKELVNAQQCLASSVARAADLEREKQSAESAWQERYERLKRDSANTTSVIERECSRVHSDKIADFERKIRALEKSLNEKNVEVDIEKRERTLLSKELESFRLSAVAELESSRLTAAQAEEHNADLMSLISELQRDSCDLTEKMAKLRAELEAVKEEKAAMEEKAAAAAAVAAAVAAAAAAVAEEEEEEEKAAGAAEDHSTISVDDHERALEKERAEVAGLRKRVAELESQNSVLARTGKEAVQDLKESTLLVTVLSDVMHEAGLDVRAYTRSPYARVVGAAPVPLLTAGSHEGAASRYAPGMQPARATPISLPSHLAPSVVPAFDAAPTSNSQPPAIMAPPSPSPGSSRGGPSGSDGGCETGRAAALPQATIPIDWAINGGMFKAPAAGRRDIKAIYGCTEPAVGARSDDRPSFTSTTTTTTSPAPLAPLAVAESAAAVAEASATSTQSSSVAAVLTVDVARKADEGEEEATESSDRQCGSAPPTYSETFPPQTDASPPMEEEEAPSPTISALMRQWPIEQDRTNAVIVGTIEDATDPEPFYESQVVVEPVQASTSPSDPFTLSYEFVNRDEEDRRE